MTETRKINCIIVDDETEALDRMESLLKHFEQIAILSKEWDAERAIQTIVDIVPDIVFIDVEMPKKTGFDVVREAREKNVFPTFIFVTGYNQYAIKAIKNAAFDYLLKPVDIDELAEAIERYECSCIEKDKNELPLKLKKEFSLTDREIEIIQLIAECKTSREIAEILFISKHTVDTHRRNILAKTEKRTIAELLRKSDLSNI